MEVIPGIDSVRCGPTETRVFAPALGLRKRPAVEFPELGLQIPATRYPPLISVGETVPLFFEGLAEERSHGPESVDFFVPEAAGSF